jgi:DME family drug/metabolite transporter
MARGEIALIADRSVLGLRRLATREDEEMVLRGYLLIVAAALLWGNIGPFSRLAFSQGIGPLEVAFWRALMAWILFAAHAVMRGELKIQRRDLGHLVAFAILGVTVFYATYQVAVIRGGAALAAVLLYTGPAWVTVMARLFFKEALTPIKLLALGLTLAGVVAVAIGSGDSGLGKGLDLLAIGAGLGSGFCYALYYIYGKHFSGRYSSPNLFLYLLPIGALSLYPLVTFNPKTPTAWMAMAALAFFCTYGAYFCYYQGLRHLEASRAAITATLEPVVAAVVAYFWWGEYFSPMGYAGSVLILAAVVLVVWDGTRRPLR